MKRPLVCWCSAQETSFDTVMHVNSYAHVPFVYTTYRDEQWRKGGREGGGEEREEREREERERERGRRVS